MTLDECCDTPRYRRKTIPERRRDPSHSQAFRNSYSQTKRQRGLISIS